MKKTMIRLLSALLLLGTVLLTACGPEQGPPAETDTDAPTETKAEGGSEAMTDVETGTEAPVVPTDTEVGTGPEEPTVELKNPEIEERYFVFRIWNFIKNSQRDFEAAVDAAQEAGFNAIKIHMPWFLFEKTSGVYDWSGFEEMFDYVINQKGMKALCSIDLTRDYAGHFFPDEAFMHTYEGKVYSGGAYVPRMQISFSCDYAMDAAVKAYAATVEHFDGLFGSDILLYLPCFSLYAETEYFIVGDYDYSDAAVAQFRTWLSARYGGIGDLNKDIGTGYASYSAVSAPAMSDTSALGLLWYQFRHEQLKGAIDRLSDAQKAVCPDTKIAIQLGCVWDAASRGRGTLGFADLCEKVDVLWVDDGPTMDHCWSMDYIRSVLPSRVQLAQEIDGPTQIGASPENYLRQGLECFERGATYVSVANFSIDEKFEAYKPVWQEIADTWLAKDHPAVLQMTEDSPVLELSLYDVYRRGSANFVLGQYTGLSDGGRFVYIRLTDDLTTRRPVSPSDVFSFPASFSSKQGDGNFSYMSYTRKKFIPMTWDAANNRWQGEAAYALIMSDGSMHPDSGVESALVFTAPKDGEVVYSYTASLISAQSTGVQFCIMLNGTRVWPEDAKYIKVGFSSPAAGSLSLTVSAGDEIAFALNPDRETAFDATSVSVDVEYK